MPQNIEDAELSVALKAWALGEPLQVTEVLGGATNRVYRVESPRAVAFLRRYARPDRALVLREHALTDHVRRAGLPAPAPITSLGGGTVVEHDGAVYALYEPARGQQLPRSALTVELARAAGEMLGRLHSVLASEKDAGYVRWSLAWDGAEWCERLSVVERALLGLGVRDATDRFALERLRAQRDWLARPECSHAHAPEFPAQVTHGDFQDANLFFAEGRVSGIIDWEQAAWMPRAYEAARAAGFMFLPRRDAAGAFLGAYRHASGVCERELLDGARAWGCFSDHHVWPLEQAYLHGNRAARRFIPHAPFRPFAAVWAEAVG